MVKFIHNIIADVLLMKGSEKMGTRRIKDEDKVKYGNLMNLGCQNKSCKLYQKRQCAGAVTYCRNYIEPSYTDYIFNTKSLRW